SCSTCAGAEIAESAPFSCLGQFAAAALVDARKDTPCARRLRTLAAPSNPGPWEGSAVRVWAALIVAGVLLAGAAPECSAQLFGSKKAKVSPQQRVPELVGILKLDKDAHKRSEAAEEL